MGVHRECRLSGMGGMGGWDMVCVRMSVMIVNDQGPPTSSDECAHGATGSCRTAVNGRSSIRTGR